MPATVKLSVSIDDLIEVLQVEANQLSKSQAQRLADIVNGIDRKQDGALEIQTVEDWMTLNNVAPLNCGLAYFLTHLIVQQFLIKKDCPLTYGTS